MMIADQAVCRRLTDIETSWVFLSHGGSQIFKKLSPRARPYFSSAKDDGMGVFLSLVGHMMDAQ